MTIFGYSFKNPSLLEAALAHKSYFFENRRSVLQHNERLEFLGDAVIDLILSHMLFAAFPEEEEGSLSKLRAAFVNETFLSDLAFKLELHEHLRLGRGEEQSQGRLKPRILSSCLEALVGAFYLDAGFEQTQKIVEPWFLPHLSKDALNFDYKSQLQELIQAKHKLVPEYLIVDEKGPAHNPQFTVMVKAKGQELATASGATKKAAEQEAAKRALESLRTKT